MAHAVLLVDDDENVLHGLVRALRRQPYQLYTAKSGAEAMWILKSHDVDVLVTDEKMPGVPGTEVLAWVTQYFPDVMRIMLTGSPTVDTAMRAINEGTVFQFFVKPCREVDLAIAIRKALERRGELREHRRLLDQAQRDGDANHLTHEGA